MRRRGQSILYFFKHTLVSFFILFAFACEPTFATPYTRTGTVVMTLISFEQVGIIHGCSERNCFDPDYFLKSQIDKEASIQHEKPSRQDEGDMVLMVMY